VLATNVFTTLRLATDDSAMTIDTIRKCTRSTIRRKINDILSIKTNDSYGDSTMMVSMSILCPNLSSSETTRSRELPPVGQTKMKMMTKK
jgi:hypothetical protein